MAVVHKPHPEFIIGIISFAQVVPRPVDYQPQVKVRGGGIGISVHIEKPIIVTRRSAIV